MIHSKCWQESHTKIHSLNSEGARKGGWNKVRSFRYQLFYILFLRISFFGGVFPKFIFIRGMICPGNIYLGHLFTVLFQVGGQLIVHNHCPPQCHIFPSKCAWNPARHSSLQCCYNMHRTSSNWDTKGSYKYTGIDSGEHITC